MKRFLLVSVAMIVLYGCGAENDNNVLEDGDQPSNAAIAYECGTQEVKVDYNNDAEPPTATLFFSGKTHDPIVLSLTVAASGAKYSDGNITFWTHPGEAALMMEGEDGAQINCDQKNVQMEEITGGSDVE